MNTKDEDRGIIPPHNFEPFPEPQTIPSGWDLSGLLPAPEPFDFAQGKPGRDDPPSAGREGKSSFAGPQAPDLLGLSLRPGGLAQRDL